MLHRLLKSPNGRRPCVNEFLLPDFEDDLSLTFLPKKKGNKLKDDRVRYCLEIDGLKAFD